MLALSARCIAVSCPSPRSDRIRRSSDCRIGRGSQEVPQADLIVRGGIMLSAFASFVCVLSYPSNGCGSCWLGFELGTRTAAVIVADRRPTSTVPGDDHGTITFRESGNSQTEIIWSSKSPQLVVSGVPQVMTPLRFRLLEGTRGSLISHFIRYHPLCLMTHPNISNQF
jgi:hypothetical protein